MRNFAIAKWLTSAKTLTFISFLFISVIGFSQKTITGRVTSGSNAPVVKASITIKGKSGGTTTDDKGDYSIKAANGDILVFSSAEFQTEEIRVSAESSTINVNLTALITNMNEVIVTGYGTTLRKNLTTSISKID